MKFVRLLIATCILFIASLFINIIQICVGLAFTNFIYIERLLIDIYGTLVIYVTRYLGMLIIPQIHVSGIDKLYALRNKTVVITSNYTGRADWLVLVLIAYQCGTLGCIKIVCSSFMRCIPGAGWIAALGNFPMLHGDWNRDRPLLETMCNTYALQHNADYPSWIFIFPEGKYVADFKDPLISLSRRFCLERRIGLYTHVLCPRIKGTQFIVSQLRTAIPDLCVIDLHISYTGLLKSWLPLTSPERVAPSVANFFAEPYIRNISIDITEVDITRDNWIYSLFALKNDMISGSVRQVPLGRDIRHKKITLICLLVFIAVLKMFSMLWLAYYAFLCLVAHTMYNYVYSSVKL